MKRRDGLIGAGALRMAASCVACIKESKSVMN